MNDAPAPSSSRQIHAVPDPEELKRQFLALVSHELRTPLTAVVGYAGMLQMTIGETLPPFEGECLRNLVQQADLLRHTLEMLVDAACIQGRTLGLIPGRLAPAHTLTQVHAGAVPGATMKKQTLTLAIEGELPVLTGDANRFGQVVQALLANAIKFSPEGGAIALHAVHRGGALRVEVRDNGPGVPPHRRAALFDSFTQADMSTTRVAGGLGLGLFVSRAIVEAMGGRLGLDFPDEGGCVAWFELPVAIEEAA